MHKLVFLPLLLRNMCQNDTSIVFHKIYTKDAILANMDTFLDISNNRSITQNIFLL